MKPERMLADISYWGGPMPELETISLVLTVPSALAAAFLALPPALRLTESQARVALAALLLAVPACPVPIGA